MTDKVNDSYATFTVVDVNDADLSASDIVFHTRNGQPWGILPPITLRPFLTHISPKVGSTAGSILKVRGEGFGPANDVDLYDETTNTGICETTIVTGYGAFDCITKPGEINITHSDQIKLQVNDSHLRQAFDCETDADNCRFDCMGNDNECKFEQSLASSAMITGASVIDAYRVSISTDNMPDDPVDWQCSLSGTPCTV